VVPAADMVGGGRDRTVGVGVHDVSTHQRGIAGIIVGAWIRKGV
jgi:hypothetical protein